MNTLKELNTSNEKLEKIQQTTKGFHIVKWASMFIFSTGAALFFLIYMPSWLAIILGQIFGSLTYGLVHQIGERELDEMTKEWSRQRQEETLELYKSTSANISDALKQYNQDLKEEQDDLLDEEDFGDDDGQIH